MSDLRFLLEIGTEEIPDWMIAGALADLRRLLQQVLDEQKLGGTVSQVDATPRRLTVRAEGLIARQSDSEELVMGPPKSAAYKDGQPTGAALGFAKKMNVSVDALRLEATDKGEYLAVLKQIPGRDSLAILSEALPSVILGIQWPKTMFWTVKGGPRFIRPIRWIVALLGDDIVHFDIAGVASGRTTQTHRQLGPGHIDVTIDSYNKDLWSGGVLISAQSRRERIEKGIHDLLNDKCMRVVPDEALLDTLVYLTEYPTPILGFFEEPFLSLPREVLIEVMRKHQRYFSVVNAQGKLMPMFIAVTNTDGDPEGLIRRGHERVLKARFQDARFFYDFDQQKLLYQRVDDLKSVTFQAQLGSYFDKAQRMIPLAAELAHKVGADPELCSRAALLAKTDLTCEMVKEFTDLQGLIGGLYAKAQGEPAPVGKAIYEHYQPLSMEHPIPSSREGQVLALADKVDTLRECFRIGLVPTGSKDPFALRRAAQGIVKILIEAKFPLTIAEIAVHDATLYDFFIDRVRYYFKDLKGFAYDEVNAALAASLSTLSDLADRLEAIKAVRPTENFEPLAAGLKRVRNILKQAGVAPAASIDENLLEPGAETDLYQSFLAVQAKSRTYRDTRNYISALAAIASLRPAVDTFFDQVHVNAPDPAVRANRLTLLNAILEESSAIADFSEIVTL